MRNFDRETTKPSPDTINLRPGAGAYPIRETVIGVAKQDAKGSVDDDSVEKEMQELAEVVQAARLVIETQGGTFNGTESRVVHRTDQEWMGSSVAISVLYALAYLPTEQR